MYEDPQAFRTHSRRSRRVRYRRAVHDLRRHRRTEDGPGDASRAGRPISTPLRIVLPVTPDDVTIAFLPSAHIAQRVVVRTGARPARLAACGFPKASSKLPNEIRTIRPTFFLAPPRVWERVYSTISTEIKKRPAAVRKLFYLGVGVGSEASRLRQAGKPVPAVDARFAAVFRSRWCSAKIRERLGGRLRIAASGAAPLGKDLAEFLRRHRHAADRRLRADRRRRGGAESAGSAEIRQHRQSCCRTSKRASKTTAN